MISKKDVEKYFKECFNYPDILFDYSSTALTFSYLVGMHPKECVNMDPYDDPDPDQWEDVNRIIYSMIKKEKMKKGE